MRNLINLILRDYITLALLFYYSKWKVIGLNNIPKTGPVILAANHQNAFLDALIIECSSRKKSHFLARASAFKSKIALAFLSYIRMMPIYRIRDGLKEVKKNDEIIDKCTSILNEGKTINLFPEGNHDIKRRIRPLQRGLARIVFGAAVKDHWKTDIKIVPAGINYEEPTNFRSRVFVEYGKPMSVNDYKDLYEKNNREGLETLSKDLEQVLKPLVIDIQPLSSYDIIEKKFLETRPYKRDLQEQISSDKQLVQDLVANKTVNIQNPDAPGKFYPHHYLFALFAFINNLVPYLITRYIIKKIVKDIAFISSIKIACGITIVPFFYIMQTLLVLYFFGFIPALVYFFSLFVSGYFGFDLLKKWISK